MIYTKKKLMFAYILSIHELNIERHSWIINTFDKLSRVFVFFPYSARSSCSNLWFFECIIDKRTYRFHFFQQYLHIFFANIDFVRSFCWHAINKFIA